MNQSFDAFNTPISATSHLIEASAGTGKTFSIAMLVLRLMVEENLNIQEILVVTFTKAATRELKERIRLRIQQALLCLDHQQTPLDHDQDLSAWLENQPDQAETEQRLKSALSDIDQAAIFTIHGFCQRVLREFALETGQLFDIEVSPSLDELQQNISYDFWRQETYQRSNFEVAALTFQFETPEKILKSIIDIKPEMTIEPETPSIDDLLAEIKTQINPLQNKIDQVIIPLEHLIKENPESFKKTFIEKFNNVLESFQCALNQQWQHAFFIQCSSLSKQELLNGLDGRKYRGEQKKLNFYQNAEIPLDLFNLIADLLNQLKLAFRRKFVDFLHDQMEQRQIKQNVISHDDLINRLSVALTQSKQKIILRDALQKKYKAALIDEFQDTDIAQWHIFSNIFTTSENHYLYLIGDPKQAIYQFRGADIYSYLEARKEAKEHHFLGINWRSHPQLISAVNYLFSTENPFSIEEIKYQAVQAGRTDHVLKINNQVSPSEAFIFMALPENPNNKTGFWSPSPNLNDLKTAKETIEISIINEIINLLKNATLDGIPVQPHDIAILTRTNPVADHYQDILLEQNIPAISSHKTSVFQSDEAKKLYFILSAIAQPTNIESLKYILTIDWFDFNASAWLDLFSQDQQVNYWLMRLQIYYDEWQKKGVMTMMRHFLANEHLQLNIAKKPRSDRVLTNIFHLLEILQQAVNEQHLGMIKLLDFFNQKIQQEEKDEAQEIRLESDANAIQITTVHRSKGLEYPIVFCPDLWSKPREDYANVVLYHHQKELKADIGSEHFANNQSKAKTEAKAENCRLLYVALTRAKYRCYAAWANVRSAKDKNPTALAYLLESLQPKKEPFDFDQLETDSNQTILHDPLQLQIEIKGTYQQTIEQKAFQYREFKRYLDHYWQMASYSSLAHLSQPDSVEELPTDKAQEMDMIDSSPILEEVEDILPKGAHTGNVVHELLELFPFSKLANRDFLDQDQAFIDKQADICFQFGLEIEYREQLNDLIQQTVQTPLDAADPHFCLANLSEQQCLKEMPFYFTAKDLDTTHINAALATCPTFLALDKKQMEGQLTGFIDLICEYNQQYYVMDYKTNFLADYATKYLEQSMHQHNYGLQYWLYSLVLHRYLAQRLEDYDYDVHFGGIKYLFVRGMKPAQAASGVYIDRPTLAQLETFAAAINQPA